MIRTCARGLSQTRLALRTITGRSRSLPPVRFSSTTGNKSGGLGVKVALTGVVATTGLVGGTVGYANYDQEFRFKMSVFTVFELFFSQMLYFCGQVI